MIIQRVLKGIARISKDDANGILREGIICNWWRKTGRISVVDIPTQLTEENLHWHQNRYEDPDPRAGGEPFGQHTPFISTTAGTAEIDHGAGVTTRYPAHDMALDFATDGFQASGFIFRCYLFVLGRRAVAHQPFGEELRDLHLYSRYSRNHPEGEVTAKVIIPPAQIKGWEFYDIDCVEEALNNYSYPDPSEVQDNTGRYVPPAIVSNIRGTI